MDVQVNFILRDDILLRDLVVLEGIGPGLRSTADLFLRFPRHFALESLDLFGSAAGQKALEISSTARPKHRLDRSFRCSVSRKAEAWGLGLCFRALYCDGGGAGGHK